MKCNTCHAVADSSDVFCGSCGRKLGNTDTNKAKTKKAFKWPNSDQNKIFTQSDTTNTKIKAPISRIFLFLSGASIIWLIIIFAQLSVSLGFSELDAAWVFFLFCGAVMIGLIYAFVKKIMQPIAIGAFLFGSFMAITWIQIRTTIVYQYAMFDFIIEFGITIAVISILYWIAKRTL